MKIGIITLPLENNYGGILQNFALQFYLKKMGHKPMTCRWTGYTTLGFVKAALFSLFKGCKNFPQTPWENRIKRQGLEQFIKNNINYRYFRFPILFLLWFKPKIMITGSDQIWRPKYNPHLYDTFLGFTKGYSIKRIAYAASFGVDNWEFSEKETKECKKLLKNFNAVSVREKSGILLCKQHFDCDAIHVADPTFLVDRQVYNNISKKIPIQEKNILIYLVDYSNQIRTQADIISNKTGLPLRIIEADNGIKPTDSIEKWLAAFRDAEYVLTDSFHGTVFSIIFNKQFICIGNEKRGLTRFCSLLNYLQLERRLIPFDQIDKVSHILLSHIDYQNVNNRLQILINESKHFLNTYLNNN